MLFDVNLGRLLEKKRAYGVWLIGAWPSSLLSLTVCAFYNKNMYSYMWEEIESENSHYRLLYSRVCACGVSWNKQRK